jgi:8-amino-7-oxononanoate synthase
MQYLAAALAELQGLERGVLGQSTFHLFWDFINWLNQGEVRFFYDAYAYPIGRWSVACQQGRASGLHRVPHHDPGALAQALATHLCSRERPVLILDGYCPVTGQLAPLTELLQVMDAYQGLILIDDTQALGIYGDREADATPYGRHGGGSLRYHKIHSAQVVVISSLAKAFGVPAAVLAGSGEVLDAFNEASLTAVHCSPVSNAHLAALAVAIKKNREQGDLLRRGLYQRVRLFRRLLHDQGGEQIATCHPFQTLTRCRDAVGCYQRLRRKGIDVVLHHGSDNEASLSCLIRVNHTPAQIRQLVRLIGESGERYENTISEPAISVTHGDGAGNGS